MSEQYKNLFEDVDQAEHYVETFRDHYRHEHGAYRGTRNEDQRLIEMVTADEARLIVDGTMAGILALRGMELPDDYEAVERAGYSWKQYRGEFEKLLVGFGILTHRLHRDGYDVPSYSELAEPDRMKAASALFGDFIAHNALRFGVDSVGIPKTDRKKIYTDDGEIEYVTKIVDKDKAMNDREINENMIKRGYRTHKAAHAAGKISPEEYRQLRLDYSEMDKDAFDRDVSFYTDVRSELESQE